MHPEIEGLVELYDRGRITRRQLLQGLLAIGVGGRLGVRGSNGAANLNQAEPLFQTRTLNHVTLNVSDVARSKAFYQKLTGLPVRDEDKTFCEFRLEGSFLGLYTPAAGRRPGFDHFCFGVEQYDAPKALAKLKAAVPDAQPTLESGDQVYVRDPDGVRVQFADVRYKR
jgi:catechol 2,3-dioxygenase-like lactoylglutathione lyase family enzyme